MSNFGTSSCPNCGRKTARTEDWACQWCGYPLPGGFYEKIEKTYKQLQAEKLHRPPAEEEVETSPPPAYEPPPPTEIAEPEPVLEVETGPAVETVPAEEPGEETEKMATEPEPSPEPPPEPPAEPMPELQAEPLPEAAEVSADELMQAYTSDPVAAEAKYMNEVLNITGTVSRVEIRKALDINYIFLTGADEELMRSIRCMFDKKHEPELLELAKGQTVTVQGKYNGSLIDFRMQNCVIVRRPPETEEQT